MARLDSHPLGVLGWACQGTKGRGGCWEPPIIRREPVFPRLDQDAHLCPLLPSPGQRCPVLAGRVDTVSILPVPHLGGKVMGPACTLNSQAPGRPGLHPQTTAEAPLPSPNLPLHPWESGPACRTPSCATTPGAGPPGSSKGQTYPPPCPWSRACGSQPSLKSTEFAPSHGGAGRGPMTTPRPGTAYRGGVIRAGAPCEVLGPQGSRGSCCGLRLEHEDATRAKVRARARRGAKWGLRPG